MSRSELTIRSLAGAVTLAILSFVASTAALGTSSGKWTLGCVNAVGLDRVSQPASNLVAAKIAADFKSDPVKPNAENLDLLSRYVDKVSGSEVLVYDVRYFADTEVVYVVDKNGSIVNRYVTSTWKTVDSDKPLVGAFQSQCR
jgi:hypothetical protein